MSVAVDLALLLVLTVLYLAVGGHLPRWRTGLPRVPRAWVQDPLLRACGLAGLLVLTGWGTLSSTREIPPPPPGSS